MSQQQKVTNLNTFPVNVKIIDAAGKPDGVHLQPRSSVTLEVGSLVSTNWLAVTPKIKVQKVGD